MATLLAPHWDLPDDHPVPHTEAEALAMAADPRVRPEVLSLVTEIDVEPREGYSLEAIHARHAARTRLLSAALGAPTLTIGVLAWLLDIRCQDTNCDPVALDDEPARALVGNINVTLWTFADEGWMRGLTPRGLCGLARGPVTRDALWRVIALGAFQHPERTGVVSDALAALLTHGTDEQRREVRHLMNLR